MVSIRPDMCTKCKDKDFNSSCVNGVRMKKCIICNKDSILGFFATDICSECSKDLNACPECGRRLEEKEDTNIKDV